MCTKSPNTILRHKQHYRKYLEVSVLHDIELKKVNDLLLEQECNRIVKEFKLSREEWTNLKTILLGMFTYTYKKHYLSENLMENVAITVKFCQIKKKTGQTETYNTEELKALIEYLNGMYAETKPPTPIM